jgi:hypothetical protein
MEKSAKSKPPRTIPVPNESRTRRVAIAKPNASKGGNRESGDVAKSIKFMIFLIPVLVRDLL